MLKIIIPEKEKFDEAHSRFVKMEGGTFEIEHSLAAIAKWEAAYSVPFLLSSQKTLEESLDYIRCMTVTPDVDPALYTRIDNAVMKQINEYIESKQTATTIKRIGNKRASREVITAEIIYYWMIAMGIPSEYDQWHLNKLLTLIEVCNTKNAPSKKMKQKDVLAQNRALNEARRAKYNTRG